MSLRVLVTGGAGFIGRALCHRLVATGHTVAVLDDLSSGDALALPQAVRFHRADICDRTALREALLGVDAVFHLAAVSSVEACLAAPAATSRTNLQGTVVLLEEAAGRPVIHTSSAAVYGNQKRLPIHETATPNPISPYAVDKLGSEWHLARAASLNGARTAALRLFNVYGPGQRMGAPSAGVVARFAELAHLGAPVVIQGDGGQVRDFVHIDDVVEALVATLGYVLRAPAGHHLCANVCSGTAVTILDLARQLSDLAGRCAPLRFAPSRLGDIRRSLGDRSRAEALIGVTPQQNLHAGLLDVLRAYDDQTFSLRAL
ncbi:MAG: NAD-dependent epimerase/dehydratase family protein [Pseudomonadota bacterium]